MLLVQGGPHAGSKRSREEKKEKERERETKKQMQRTNNETAQLWNWL